LHFVTSLPFNFFSSSWVRAKKIEREGLREMKNFRAYQLSLSFFRLCKTIQLPYYLRDQLLRAASSITLNLAEGSSKPTKKEQKRFYNIALASLRECQAVFDLHKVSDLILTQYADQLGAMMYCLIRSRE
jgi:four helix bundle protein